MLDLLFAALQEHRLIRIRVASYRKSRGGWNTKVHLVAADAIAALTFSLSGAKRKKGSKLHLAVDKLGHMLAMHVTPANVGDRAEVGHMAEAIQAATDQSVEIAFVDQGYTGEKPEKAAAGHGIQLKVVKLPEAKLGFVLLPRRWVVERSFA